MSAHWIELELTRRGLLGAAAATMAGCVIPSRAPPAIDHLMYPAGPLPPLAGSKHRLAVGAFKIDLTPPPGARVWLAGYGFQRAMSAVADPISARCIYFDDGERRVALVVADVVGFMRPTVERVRRLVGPQIEVAVAATHNHQSPDTMGYWGKALLYTVPYSTGIDAAYLRVMERRLAAAVVWAARAARPADLWLARAELPDGLVQNLRTPGTYDRGIELLEARTPSGEVITTFVNFGCHPETLGDRAKLLSSDFPGVLCTALERARGGHAIFANGVLGGMVTPDVDASAAIDDRVRLAERIGREAARVSIEALDRAERAPASGVRYQRVELELPSDNALYSYVHRVGLIERRRVGAGGGFITEVGRVDLGDAAWALVPGEPSPMVGARIRAALASGGVAHPAVIGLANDELGYLLDPTQFDDDVFAYEASVSAGRDAAVRLEAALATLSR